MDLALNQVYVEHKGTVVKEVDQAGPVAKGVADIFCQHGFLRNARELSLQPELERCNDRGGLGAPDGEPIGDSLAAHGLLDLIQQSNLAQHLLGDERALDLKAFDEAAADIGSARDQLSRAAVAHDLGQRIVKKKSILS